MSDDNIVTFRPPGVPSAEAPITRSEQELCEVVQNLMAYCERLEEGMQHISQVLIGMDSRLRKLELAHNKAEREKAAKPTIFNPQGKRVS